MADGDILPRVMVSVHGRWHAFELARFLSARGMLSRITTTYPRYYVRRLLGNAVDVRSAFGLELRRRLFDRFKIGQPPDLYIARTFAEFAASNLTSEANVFTGWSSASLEAIPVARDMGMKIVIERGSTHIGHQRTVLQHAYEELGLDGQLPSDEIVARELEEYRSADQVFVPSEYVKQTFIDNEVSAEKITVNPYGVDLSKYAMVDRSQRSGPVEILFVGGVGVRKGVPWLIQAFSKMRASAKLRLVGPIDPRMRTYAQSRADAWIEFAGALSGDDLNAAYRRADIFCLPSLEEGFPLAMLEAMATGLPVITTAAAGGGAVKDGRHGIVVSAGDTEALEEALRRLSTDTRLRLELGMAGRQLTERDYSWDDYGRRAEIAYRAMLKA